eukprot:jgi/Tetstr1/432932/TSEL_022272.t1
MSQDGEEAGKSLVRVESARSGRSSCRSCGEKIALGETRFGVEAWIAGRVAVGWLRQSCFQGQLALDVASNARAKCKHCGEKFAKGETRFAVCNYLKMFVKLGCVDDVLREAAKAFGSNGPTLEDIQGFRDLDAAQQAEVAAAVTVLPRAAQKASGKATGKRAAAGGEGRSKKKPKKGATLQ